MLVQHTCFSPSSLGLIPSIPKEFSKDFFYVAEVNQLYWLEESVQWLENVVRTHLVLASGEPVLQKTC